MCLAKMFRLRDPLSIYGKSMLSQCFWLHKAKNMGNLFYCASVSDFILKILMG